jgi:hypothetical protein
MMAYLFHAPNQPDEIGHLQAGVKIRSGNWIDISTKTTGTNSSI